MDSQTAEVRKVALMTRGIKVAMLTTTAPDGTLHSRPMATQQADFDGVLWFLTKSHCVKVDEIHHDAEVNVSYASPEDNRYVSISGTASLVRDPDKIRELWNDSYAPWFSQGVDDPEIALLRVEVHTVAYWDMLTGGMVTLPAGKPAGV
jgi:general stress protein 26